LQQCTEATNNNLAPAERIDALTECAQRQIAIKLNETIDEITFQSRVRKDMGDKLRAYSCDSQYNAMVQATTTPSILNATWNGHNTKTLFESDYSSVVLIEQFLTSAECQIILKSRSLDQLQLNKLQQKADQLVGMMDVSRDFSLRVMEMTSDDECEIQQDGSCSSASAAGASSNVPVTVSSDENVAARLIVLCSSSSIPSDKQQQQPVKGGMLYFPKTGVRILPHESNNTLQDGGSAVLIQYETAGKRDKDPYLDEHVICPVLAGTVGFVEQVYPSSSSSKI
jgi:hypothetical protein